MTEQNRNEKKILTPDLFELNEKGEVVIKDKDLASRMVDAKKRGDNPGEQGISVGVVVEF